METASFVSGSPAGAVGGLGGQARALGRALLLAALTTASNAHCRARTRLAKDPLRVAIRLNRRLARALVRVLGVSIEVRGRVPPGVVLLVVNHRSYVDIPVLMAHVSAVFLAKQEIADWPLFGTAARLAQTIFVRREERPSRKAALAAIAAALDAGHAVALFPEGTTSAEPGTRPFRPGAFYLAVEKGIPVVPIAIAYGSPDDAWVGDDSFVRHFLERFGLPEMRVSVAIGPPLRGTDGGELRDAAEAWIGDRVDRLERELGTRNAVPPMAEDDDRTIDTDSVLLPPRPPGLSRPLPA